MKKQPSVGQETPKLSMSYDAPNDFSENNKGNAMEIEVPLISVGNSENGISGEIQLEIVTEEKDENKVQSSQNSSVSVGEEGQNQKGG